MCEIILGNYQQALQCYKQIHLKFPDSVDCLKLLVKLCSDLGLKESQEYSLKLKKAEKLLEVRRQVSVVEGGWYRVVAVKTLVYRQTGTWLVQGQEF